MTKQATAAGVCSGQAGGGVRRGTYPVGLLAMAAIPVPIASAAVGVPSPGFKKRYLPVRLSTADVR